MKRLNGKAVRPAAPQMRRAEGGSGNGCRFWVLGSWPSAGGAGLWPAVRQPGRPHHKRVVRPAAGVSRWRVGPPRDRGDYGGVPTGSRRYSRLKACATPGLRPGRSRAPCTECRLSENRPTTGRSQPRAFDLRPSAGGAGLWPAVRQPRRPHHKGVGRVAASVEPAPRRSAAAPRQRRRRHRRRPARPHSPPSVLGFQMSDSGCRMPVAERVVARPPAGWHAERCRGGDLAPPSPALTAIVRP